MNVVNNVLIGLEKAPTAPQEPHIEYYPIIKPMMKALTSYLIFDISILPLFQSRQFPNSGLGLFSGTQVTISPFIIKGASIFG
jgi:hypothetical protein